MRIVIFTEYFPSSAKGEVTGGVEARAFFAAQELAKQHEVTIVCSRRPREKKEDAYLGLSIRRVGPAYEYTATGHLVKRILFGIAAIHEARRLGVKAEVIDGYSYFCYPAAILSPKGARKFLTYHEVWLDSWGKNTGRSAGVLGELAERAVLWLARVKKTNVIAVSGFTKSKLIEQGITAKQISVVPNGVSLVKYKTDDVKKFGIPTICYVGRLAEHKRVDDLVKGFAGVRKKVKRCQLIIVGDGPERDIIEKLVDEQGLTESVKITGYLKSHDEVIRTLKKSHVFCSPSVLEGFGITVVEAAASGVPYVISDIPPYREVTKQGLGGLFFRPRDIKDLAKKLEKMLTDKKLYAKCKRETKKLVSAYDWKKIAKDIEEVYSR